MAFNGLQGYHVNRLNGGELRQVLAENSVGGCNVQRDQRGTWGRVLGPHRSIRGGRGPWRRRRSVNFVDQVFKTPANGQYKLSLAPGYGG